jgi:maltose alpha-D-glucosyltransferase/alpha-amylase
MNDLNNLKHFWQQLYPDGTLPLCEDFIEEMKLARDRLPFPPQPEAWYKDAVVYSLYVDLFNKDFPGLIGRLGHLKDLGINCIWMLPILDSPMRDAGFDIRDYRHIRPGLLGKDIRDEETSFSEFLEQAHNRGMKVIFDFAFNHTSDQHPWFQEARKSKENPFRNYYIWSPAPDKYAKARIIFEGLCTSNWEKAGGEYYFHRFFEFQPDLNYREPKVLLEMCRNLLFWISRGVDGFRADAIPYLWKEEETDCENLPQTHVLVRFFRTVVEYVRPRTLLLAEACQKPLEVVKYFGEGDECNACYHFPLMPRMFKSLSLHDKKPIVDILRPAATPPIPADAQWFTFLRCHDELSLELVYVSEKDRKYLHDTYCRDPRWDFRQGQGISARLADLLGRDPARISLAMSIMLTLPGTPVIFYGDEFGKTNDEDYYAEMIRVTGKDDTRFLVRGRIDWNGVEAALRDENSYTSQVLRTVRLLITTRNKYKAFGRGAIEWITAKDREGSGIPSILCYKRKYNGEHILVIQNLSGKALWIHVPGPDIRDDHDLLGRQISCGSLSGHLLMQPFAFHWINTQE